MSMLHAIPRESIHHRYYFKLKTERNTRGHESAAGFLGGVAFVNIFVCYCSCNSETYWHFYKEPENSLDAARAKGFYCPGCIEGNHPQP